MSKADEQVKGGQQVNLLAVGLGLAGYEHGVIWGLRAAIPSALIPQQAGDEDAKNSAQRALCR